MTNLVTRDIQPTLTKVLEVGLRNKLLPESTLSAIENDGAQILVQVAKQFGNPLEPEHLRNALEMTVECISLYLNSLQLSLDALVTVISKHSLAVLFRGGYTLIHELEQLPATNLSLSLSLKEACEAIPGELPLFIRLLIPKFRSTSPILELTDKSPESVYEAYLLIRMQRYRNLATIELAHALIQAGKKPTLKELLDSEVKPDCDKILNTVLVWKICEPESILVEMDEHHATRLYKALKGRPTALKRGIVVWEEYAKSVKAEWQKALASSITTLRSAPMFQQVSGIDSFYAELEQFCNLNIKNPVMLDRILKKSLSQPN